MGLTLSYPPISSDPTKGLGLGMGWEHLKELGKETKVVPGHECEITHDPQLGFEGQRKLRGKIESKFVPYKLKFVPYELYFAFFICVSKFEPSNYFRVSQDYARGDEGAEDPSAGPGLLRGRARRLRQVLPQELSVPFVSLFAPETPLARMRI